MALAKMYTRTVDGVTQFYSPNQALDLNGMNVYNPTEQMIKDAGWVEYVEEKTPEELLAEAKDTKIFEIDQYDKSDAVNSFSLNGLNLWLDKEMRVGLMNSTKIEKAAGNESTTLWFGTNSFVIPVDTAIQLLSALEIYALKCYNVTLKHKKEILDMTNTNDVLNFDITADYPEKLALTF